MCEISYKVASKFGIILKFRNIPRCHKFLIVMAHCAQYRALLFKRIYYVSVLYRRDQICLVKFLFTFPPLFPQNTSSRFVRSAPARARYFPSALSCAGMSAAGTQFPQFLLISIPVAAYLRALYHSPLKPLSRLQLGI